MLREVIDDVVRSWDAYERARGARAVVDYDCAPPQRATPPAANRLEVRQRLSALLRQVDPVADSEAVAVLQAHLALLGGLLGERHPLGDYVQATQGCPAAGWPGEHVEAVRWKASAALGDLGVGWGRATEADLSRLEGPVEAAEAPKRIRAAAAEVEPLLRARALAYAGYRLSIETADVDDYWSYWLDGAGPNARLRFNLRHSAFTEVRIRQFALHEILGHAVPFASYAARARVGLDRAESWPRALGVHLPYQVFLEGLAQAMPLLLTPHDAPVVARVRLDHYVQLVRAELHQAINDGVAIDDCAAHARARVPWWSSDTIADALADRGTDPLLRSYLWAYPAGIDWFVALADHADAATVQKVLQAAYRRPLRPCDLAALWPAGPTLGGPGDPVRLRRLTAS
jgi:hypothetical protein